MRNHNYYDSEHIYIGGKGYVLTKDSPFSEWRIREYGAPVHCILGTAKTKEEAIRKLEAEGGEDER